MKTLICLILISQFLFNTCSILRENKFESDIKSLSVQLSLDESELKEQHKHIDLIGGGIQTLSYEMDVLTESIKGLHLGQ